MFDETSWALTVEGRLVAVERKPLALLHELLLNAGEVVTKEELLDRIWPGIFVEEASLTTAMRKLRKAIGDERKDDRVIETVSGIGYRLTVPVEVETVAHNVDPDGQTDLVQPQARPARNEQSLFPFNLSQQAAAVGLALAVFLGASLVATVPPVASSRSNQANPVSPKEVIAAIRRLDLERIEQMSLTGWDPNKPLNKDGNVAFNIALEICEWNPAHDREKLLLLVRMLYDAGARLDVRNVWGDTPYSIAKAERYCGPSHPVTKMMHTECFSGQVPLGDKCLATYEIDRRDGVRPSDVSS